MSTHKLSSGFTLIETLVAVSIVTLSIVGPMVAANRAIVAAETARDQLTAAYLAQEGVEYVRAIRDDAYLATYPVTTSSWTNFVNSASLAACISPGTCNLVPIGAGASCLGSSCTSPFALVTNGTKFTRTVQITNVTTTDERITSKVTWTFHSTTHTVTITNHLTPWQ